MKTYLTYGFLLTLTNFLLTLVLFICGLQSDPAHMGTGRLIGGLGGIALAVIFIVLGIRAQRSALPAGGAFTYGQAFVAGFWIQCFASIFSVFTTYLYFTVINSHFIDAVRQVQVEKMQERGMSSDQIEQAQHFVRIFTGPTAMSIFACIGSLIVGTIIVLIAAAILQRPATGDQAAT